MSGQLKAQTNRLLVYQHILASNGEAYKLCITDPLRGESPGSNGFTAHKASNTVSVSMSSWCIVLFWRLFDHMMARCRLAAITIYHRDWHLFNDCNYIDMGWSHQGYLLHHIVYIQSIMMFIYMVRPGSCQTPKRYNNKLPIWWPRDFTTSGPLLTKRTDVLPQDLVDTQVAGIGFIFFQSIWNLISTSAAALSRCLSTFRAIRYF